MRLSPAQSLRFCGRQFSPAELEELRSWLAEGQLNRCGLARRVCAELGWVNGTGQPKLMSCRVALLRMERAGLLRLPPPQNRNGNGSQRSRHGAAVASFAEPPFPSWAETMNEWTVAPVTTAAHAAEYRHLMVRYHYLGDTPLAGAQLRYVIRGGVTALGAMGFGAAAWSVAARDQFLGWSAAQRQARLHLIVNQSRFLLLPGVRSRNLASCALAQVARQLPGQWEARYGYRPVLLESFVEKDRFTGTCYQAANWRCLGVGKGRGKLEQTGRSVLPVKWIYIYPLCPDFLTRLNQ